MMVGVGWAVDFRARCLRKDLDSDGPPKLDIPRAIDNMVRKVRM